MFRPSEVQKITNKQLHGGFISFNLPLAWFVRQNLGNSTVYLSSISTRNGNWKSDGKTFSLLAFAEGVFHPEVGEQLQASEDEKNCCRRDFRFLDIIRLLVWTGIRVMSDFTLVFIICEILIWKWRTWWFDVTSGWRLVNNKKYSFREFRWISEPSQWLENFRSPASQVTWTFELGQKSAWQGKRVFERHHISSTCSRWQERWMAKWHMRLHSYCWVFCWQSKTDFLPTTKGRRWQKKNLSVRSGIESRFRWCGDKLIGFAISLAAAEFPAHPCVHPANSQPCTNRELRVMCELLNSFPWDSQKRGNWLHAWHLHIWDMKEVRRHGRHEKKKEKDLLFSQEEPETEAGVEGNKADDGA